MDNLRIDNVNINDNKTIVVSFTHELISNLNETNVSIISETLGVPDSQCVKAVVNKNILNIYTTPLQQFAVYYILFKSTTNRPFISLNNTARLSEDGVVNKYSITGPMPEDNPVKDFLKSYYAGNIYDTESAGLIGKYIDGLSGVLSKTLYDIGQVKNENYISHTVVDELKIRSGGPSDRLSEEGAYQLLRVGRTQTGFNANKSISFESFPFYPITLQGINYQESLTINTNNEKNTFNKIDFILNLSKNPAVKLNSVQFIMNNVNQVYNYSIEKFGYQILDSRYDQQYAFTYNQITDSQIKLSDKLLEDSNFIIDDIVNVIVNYQYKNLGIYPDENSIAVSAVKNQIREVLPSIINVFNLQNNNIVDKFGKTITLGGISFLDPNSNDVNAKHPAFKKEIEFKLSSLPSVAGQYAIDYITGTVYVYGADSNNDGTGASPPLATYYYTYTYVLDQDYVYDDNFVDLVSLPTGNLRSEIASINFNYEQVLIPDVDYKASLHIEKLDERIENKLVALNVLEVENGPITNVFRIYNSTSGEVYNIDRWLNNKVYFTYNTPPSVLEQLTDRASFENINNELLFVSTESLNSNLIRIFKLLLNNNEIISSSEDGIGYFLNSSLIFSNNLIFKNEKWFNYLDDIQDSINKIENIGEYIVDYKNGVIYVGVSLIQDNDLGIVNYKKNSIVPTNDHVLSVENIYYQLSPLSNIEKNFTYTSFSNNSIVVEALQHMDEQIKNDIGSAQYYLYNNLIGVFEGFNFYPGVSYKIKDVRVISEFADITNSYNPINFAPYSTFSGNVITVGPINKKSYYEVNYNLTDGYYILLNESIPYLSNNITYTFSVIRPSSQQQLWDNSGVIEPGDNLKLTLPGINFPVANETVYVEYNFSVNNNTQLVVDYNRGELYVNYTYLNDEIIVSYEYGDNVIDFRESTSVSEGEEYYTTYRVGALREALFNNFGRLLDVPELNNFGTDFDRERYRDAVYAGLSSFVQGPTVNAIKNIGETISHIKPIISESIFDGWSLGNSLLNSSEIKMTGNFQLVNGKFNNAIMVSESDQTISFPYYSNIKLEDGTFESWVIPNWDGLSNNAELTFEITKNNSYLNANEIFIGSYESHPDIINNKFIVNNAIDFGEPNLNKDGVYIYIIQDSSKLFSKWVVQLIDGYSSTVSNYKIKINSNGSIYNFKSDEAYSDVSSFSGKSLINLTVLPTSTLINRKFTFISDVEKYLLDFGSGELSKNRVSLFKDVNGYIVFRVYDLNGKQYNLSYDVSNWNKYEKHHIGISWKLNTKNHADEMHLFIDGMEVPNIYKYGQKHNPYLYDDFRTVSSEEILGLSDKDIVSSIDLHTTIGSNIVSSSINFDNYNISVGDNIYINEVWFDESGYTITNVNGQQLTLSSNMPITLSDARFVINKTDYTVNSYVGTASNVLITRIPVFLSGNDLLGTINTNIISSSIDFEDEGVLPGYSLRVDGYLSSVFPIISVDGNQLIIDGYISQSFSDGYFFIYGINRIEIPGRSAVRASYKVGLSSDGYDTITFENNVFANDLLLINTLGLNSQNITSKHYLWSDYSEHVLLTKLPPPIDLDNVDIRKIILQKTKIDSSNSTIVVDKFESNELHTTQPTNSQTGRTLAINISGTNIDFSQPVEVMINGVSEIYTITETVVFNNTLDGYEQFTNNLFHSINWVKVNVKPLNINKPGVIVEVKEKYSILDAENDGLVPVIKYSYHMGSGTTLYSTDGYHVSDDNNAFSFKDVGNYLLIHSPYEDGDGYTINVPGFYLITDISEDRKTLEIKSTIASFTQPIDSFTDGYYTILNTTDYRSGLQNGYFMFECEGMPSVPWLMPKGYYEFKYKTYLRIPFSPSTGLAYLGSDIGGKNQFDGIIDEVKVYSTMLTDTRIGESIPVNERSITKDYNSLIELTADENTLMLLNFNSLPIQNLAKKYVYNDDYKSINYSNAVVNQNFGNSIYIADKPLVLSNDGLLDASKEGTIEFWTSPQYDTGNDPNERYYFDAFGAVIEETVSENNTTIKLNNSIEKVLSIKLTNNDNSVNYFDGAKIEIDTDRTIREIVETNATTSVVATQNVLQVSSVKIEGDLTNKDYFNNGVIDSDHKTIYLGTKLPLNNINVIITYQSIANQNDKLNKQVIRLNKKLPYHNTPITITYIPKNMRGDRLSIYKDNYGYINFSIISNNIENIVRAPTKWVNGTWHRIKASYIVNSKNYSDQMRLWVDGYEYSNFLFGDNYSFNSFPLVFGASQPGDGYYIGNEISFKDSINTIFIGSAYDKTKNIYSLIDNFRISNVSRPIYKPYGESIDVNYNSNISAVLPITEDLYTTFLLDLKGNREETNQLSTLKNRETGLFNFLVKIIDSYGIISSNDKSKEVLEKLINILKPANTRAYIKYVS